MLSTNTQTPTYDKNGRINVFFIRNCPQPNDRQNVGTIRNCLQSSDKQSLSMVVQSFCSVTTNKPCNTIPFLAIKDFINTLIDEGANNGVRGKGMKLIRYNQYGQTINFNIAGDHQMTNLKLGTFCSVVLSKQGDFLGIWNKYADFPNHRSSIQSKIQL